MLVSVAFSATVPTQLAPQTTLSVPVILLLPLSVPLLDPVIEHVLGPPSAVKAPAGNEALSATDDPDTVPVIVPLN